MASGWYCRSASMVQHVAAARVLEAAPPAGRDAQVRRDGAPRPRTGWRSPSASICAAVPSRLPSLTSTISPRMRRRSKTRSRPLDQLGEIVLLVEAGDDDAQLDGGGLPGHGACSYHRLGATGNPRATAQVAMRARAVIETRRDVRNLRGHADLIADRRGATAAPSRPRPAGARRRAGRRRPARGDRPDPPERGLQEGRADARCSATAPSIAFNGEIYNWRALRRELEAKGCRFETPTDTEVVLCAYLEWGPACLDRFNGMFAVAIWHDERLFLARDRLGKKPLFYAHGPAALGFASELKVLPRSRASPRCRSARRSSSTSTSTRRSAT